MQQDLIAVSRDLLGQWYEFLVAAPPAAGHDDLAACAEHFRKIAPGFREVPGLIRKQFIYAEDGWAGGVYLWKTRAQAEAFYSGPWVDGIRERYGMDPQIKYFNTACITDNSAEAVLLPDAAD